MFAGVNTWPFSFFYIHLSKRPIFSASRNLLTIQGVQVPFWLDFIHSSNYLPRNKENTTLILMSFFLIQAARSHECQSKYFSITFLNYKLALCLGVWTSFVVSLSMRKVPCPENEIIQFSTSRYHALIIIHRYSLTAQSHSSLKTTHFVRE